jgi:hypothetical protein
MHDLRQPLHSTAFLIALALGCASASVFAGGVLADVALAEVGPPPDWTLQRGSGCENCRGAGSVSYAGRTFPCQQCLTPENQSRPSHVLWRYRRADGTAEYRLIPWEEHERLLKARQ